MVFRARQIKNLDLGDVEVSSNPAIKRILDGIKNATSLRDLKTGLENLHLCANDLYAKDSSDSNKKLLDYAVTIYLNSVDIINNGMKKGLSEAAILSRAKGEIAKVDNPFYQPVAGAADKDASIINESTQAISEALNTIGRKTDEFNLYANWNDLEYYVSIGKDIDDGIAAISSNLYILAFIPEEDRKPYIRQIETVFAGLEGAGIVVKGGLKIGEGKDGKLEVESASQRAVGDFAFGVASCINHFNRIDNLLKAAYVGAGSTEAAVAAIEDFEGENIDGRAKDYAIRAIFGDSTHLGKMNDVLSNALGTSPAGFPRQGKDGNSALTLGYAFIANILANNVDKLNRLFSDAQAINPDAAQYLFEAKDKTVLLPKGIKKGQSNRSAFNMFSTVAGLDLIRSNEAFSTPMGLGMAGGQTINEYQASVILLANAWNSFKGIMAKALADPHEIEHDDFIAEFQKITSDITSVSQKFAANSQLATVKGKIDGFLTTLTGLGAEGAWEIATDPDVLKTERDSFMLECSQFDLTVTEAGVMANGLNRPKDIFVSLDGAPVGMSFWLLSKPEMFINIYKNEYDLIDINSKSKLLQLALSDSYQIYSAFQSQNRIGKLVEFTTNVATSRLWSDNLLANFTNQMFTVKNGYIRVSPALITGEYERSVLTDATRLLTDQLPQHRFGQWTPIEVPRSPYDLWNDSYIPSQAQVLKSQSAVFMKKSWAGVYLRDIFLRGASTEYSLDIVSASAELDRIFRRIISQGTSPALFDRSGTGYLAAAGGMTERSTTSGGGGGALGKTDRGGLLDARGVYYREITDTTQSDTFSFLDQAKNFKLVKDGFLDRMIIDDAYGSAYVRKDVEPDLVFGHKTKTVSQDISQTLNASGENSRLLARFNRHYFSADNISESSSTLLFTFDENGISDSNYSSLASQLQITSDTLSSNKDKQDGVIGSQEIDGKIYVVSKKTVLDANQKPHYSLEVHQATGTQSKNEWYYDEAHVYYRIAGSNWVEFYFNDEYRNDITKYLGQQLEGIRNSEFVQNYCAGAGVIGYKEAQGIGYVQARVLNQKERQATDVGFFIGMGSEELGKRLDMAAVGGMTVDKESAAGIIARGDGYDGKPEGYHKHTFWASYYELDARTIQDLPTSSGFYIGSNYGQARLDSYRKIESLGRVGAVGYSHESFDGALFNLSFAGSDRGFAGGRTAYQSKSYSKDGKGTGSLLRNYGYFSWADEELPDGSKKTSINSATVGTEGEFQSIPMKYVLQYNDYPNSTRTSYKGAIKIEGESKKGVEYGFNLSMNWYNPPTNEDKELLGGYLYTDISVLSSAYEEYQAVLDNPYHTEQELNAASDRMCKTMNNLFNSADYSSIFKRYGTDISDISLTFTRQTPQDDGTYKTFGGVVSITSGKQMGVPGPMVSTFLDFNNRWGIVAMTSAESPGKIQTLGGVYKSKNANFKAVIIATRISKDAAAQEMLDRGMPEKDVLKTIPDYPTAIAQETKEPLRRDKYIVEAGIGIKNNVIEASASTLDDFYKLQFTHAGKKVTYIVNLTRVGSIRDFSDGFTNVGMKGVGYFGSNRIALGLGTQFYKDIIKKNIELEYMKTGRFMGTTGYGGAGFRYEGFRDKNDFLFYLKFGLNF